MNIYNLAVMVFGILVLLYLILGLMHKYRREANVNHYLGLRDRVYQTLDLVTDESLMSSSIDVTTVYFMLRKNLDGVLFEKDFIEAMKPEVKPKVFLLVKGDPSGEHTLSAHDSKRLALKESLRVKREEVQQCLDFNRLTGCEDALLNYRDAWVYEYLAVREFDLNV